MCIRVLGLLAVAAGAPCAFGQDVDPLGADIGPILPAEAVAAVADVYDVTGVDDFERMRAMIALRPGFVRQVRSVTVPSWQRYLDAFRAGIRAADTPLTGERAVAVASLAYEAVQDAAQHGNPLFAAVVDRDLEVLGVPPAARDALLGDLRVGNVDERAGFGDRPRLRLRGEPLPRLEAQLLQLRLSGASGQVARVEELATATVHATDEFTDPFVSILAHAALRAAWPDLQLALPERAMPSLPTVAAGFESLPFGATLSRARCGAGDWWRALPPDAAGVTHEPVSLEDQGALAVRRAALPAAEREEVALVRGVLEPVGGGHYRITWRADDAGFLLINRCLVGSSWRSRVDRVQTAELVLDPRPYAFELVAVHLEGDLVVDVSLERWDGATWRPVRLDLRPRADLAERVR
jgi:uncharacterized protein GlcG (DUF336 family)